MWISLEGFLSEKNRQKQEENGAKSHNNYKYFAQKFDFFAGVEEHKKYLR